jgi:uncharacterized membrane protein
LLAIKFRNLIRMIPIGNLTGMTDAERATVTSWYAQRQQ